jgi:hypothetical protein
MSFSTIKANLTSLEADRRDKEETLVNLTEEKKKVEAKIFSDKASGQPEDIDDINLVQTLESQISTTKADLLTINGNITIALNSYESLDPWDSSVIGSFDDNTPILLTPVRIETRYETYEHMGVPQYELWIRIFPENLHMQTHEKALSDEELEDGTEFYDLYSDTEKTREEKLNAWNNLCVSYGTERAAWIAKYFDEELTNEKFDSWSQQPETRIMPDKFIGYYTGPFTYRRDYTEYNTYHEPNSNPSQYPKTYSNSYNTIRIRRVNDLAGWLANVATPIAEVLQHAINGESMYKNNKNVKDENKPASENDRDEYYKISAPDADLFGNVDAIGIYYAYKKLQHHGTKLRLSDVFELYYNGSCSSGLTPKDDAVLIPDTSQPMPHTTDKRWLIFGIHFGFVRFAGINKYTWLPNYKYAWNKFLSSAESNLNNRITSFAEFWTTRLAIYGKNDTWGTKQAKEWYRVRKAGALMVFNRDPFIEYTFKFHPSNEWLQGNDLLTKIVNNKKYFFEEKFLPWLKAKIHTDNPNITLK